MTRLNTVIGRQPGGIDLHSNNGDVVVMDEIGASVFRSVAERSVGDRAGDIELWRGACRDRG